MRSFTVVHVLLLLLFLLAWQCTSAQDYIISTRGDSLPGSVKPILFGADKKVQVTTAGERKVFPLVQVRSFVKDGETYHPIKGPRGYDFMKLLRTGYLSIYGFQLEGQVSYDGLLLVKKDGAQLEVPNLGFKKFVTKFLSDCPEVSARVDSGELGKKELNQIVDSYNACVNARTVDHKRIIVQEKSQSSKLEQWTALEEKINSKTDFAVKTDALEMIAEIKGKITRNEKVPNFLIDGVRKSLAGTDLSSDAEVAINNLQ